MRPSDHQVELTAAGSPTGFRPFPGPMEGHMAEQKRKDTRPTKPAEGGGDGAAGSPEIAKKGKKIKEDIDKLLDEIDDILEENAEEFVKSYVQRGGE